MSNRISVPFHSRWSAMKLGIAVFAAAFFWVGDVASRLWAGWDERERELALQPVPRWRPMRQVERPLWLCGAAANAAAVRRVRRLAPRGAIGCAGGRGLAGREPTAAGTS